MADTDFRPGSTADFERLYQQSYARVVFTLLGMLGDHAEAEDCAQEAYAQAFTAWPRWKPDAPAEAWIHRIAINVAISNRRRQRLREVGELVKRIGRPVPAVDPADVASRADLLSALRRIPPKQAAVVILRHNHGYSNREIAAALAIPEATVASRLVSAKARLRLELGDAWRTSSGPKETSAMSEPLGEMVSKPNHGVSFASKEPDERLSVRSEDE
jgi:RNA polymerase sigma-70 factor (ECF subfamily)